MAKRGMIVVGCLLLGLLVAAAGYQSQTYVLGRYYSSPPTLANGQASPVMLDSTGHIVTTAGGGTVNTVPLVVTSTDRSGTVTTGGTSQALMGANASRHAFSIQNRSATDALYLGINQTASTSATGKSYKILPGAIYTFSGTVISQEAINITGDNTGDQFTATEW